MAIKSNFPDTIGVNSLPAMKRRKKKKKKVKKRKKRVLKVFLLRRPFGRGGDRALPALFIGEMDESG